MFRDLVLAVAGMLWAALLVLVAARFVALLAGADESSALIQELYRHSNFWVEPFSDIGGLTDKAFGQTGIFEPASLVAFLVYFIAGTILLGILRNTFFGPYREHYA